MGNIYKLLENETSCEFIQVNISFLYQVQSIFLTGWSLQKAFFRQKYTLDIFLKVKFKNILVSFKRIKVLTGDPVVTILENTCHRDQDLSLVVHPNPKICRQKQKVFVFEHP